MPRPTILVTGATGQQGGAAARHLLRDGWTVRVLVRDRAAPAAQALQAAGAELVAGDMADRASLDVAAKGAHGVFSVQPATFAGVEVDEERMGCNVADAAQAAGVEHLVYTSVGGIDRGIAAATGWQPKARIEEHIATLDVPTTILRPVMFMENHSHPHIGVRGSAAVLRMMPTGSHVQLIAADDIGAFAAVAFADPDAHAGKAYELAGDELDRDELVAAITEAVGTELDLAPLPESTLATMNVRVEDLVRDGSFGNWHADIPALRRLHPGLLTFAGWLDAGGRAALRAHVG